MSVNILALNYWNFSDCHCVSLNYYCVPASALVVSGKLVLCFTTYRKIVSVDRRLYGDSLHQKLLILD